MSGDPKKKQMDDLKAKADAGDAEAASALGLLFELGLGVDANVKEAAKYWGVAAKNGDAMAQFSLASIISTSFADTEEHRAMSQVLFKKAEEQGFVREDKALRLLEREKGQAIKVLIVDDSTTIRTPMKRYLEADGCEVIEADDGQQGLDILKKNPDIKLVFTDLNMPVMDGLQMLKIMRGLDEIKDIPVIIITTENNDEMVKRGKAMGIQGWIVKPAKPHILRKHLLKYT